MERMARELSVMGGTKSRGVRLSRVANRRKRRLFFSRHLRQARHWRIQTLFCGEAAPL